MADAIKRVSKHKKVEIRSEKQCKGFTKDLRV